MTGCVGHLLPLPNNRHWAVQDFLLHPRNWDGKRAVPLVRLARRLCVTPECNESAVLHSNDPDSHLLPNALQSRDRSIRCFDSDHKAAVGIAVILLLIYNIMMPLAILFITLWKRHRLQEKRFRAMFGPVMILQRTFVDWKPSCCTAKTGFSFPRIALRYPQIFL